MTQLTGKTLVLPKGIESRDLQEVMDSNPEVAGVLGELSHLVKQLSPTESKLLLEKLGVVSDDSRMSFREFIDYALAPHHPEVAEVYNVHELWLNLLQVEYPDKNLLIFAPVDSWKSTVMGVMYPLYLMYLTKDVRIGVVSELEDLSKRRVVQARRIIEENPVLPELGIKKPARAYDWGEKSFTIDRKLTAGDPTMRAYGVDGAIQGRKVDLMIFDDVVSIENSRTEAARELLREKVQKEVLSRLTKMPPPPIKKARFIAIGTAFHRDDLMHEFGRGFEGAKPLFKEFRFKAVYFVEDYNDAPDFVKAQIDSKKFTFPDAIGEERVCGFLFPERLDREFLLETLETRKERFFNLNYQQIPMDDETSMIDPKWVEECYRTGLTFGPHLWPVFRKHGYKLCFIFDPAVARNKKEAEKRDTDFWVMLACAYNQKLDSRVILDFRRGRGNSKSELIAIAREFYDSFADPETPGKLVISDVREARPKWFVEDVSAQDFLVQDMEEEFGRTIVFGISTHFVSKNSGLNGLPAVALAFEKRAYVLPAGDARSMTFVEILKKEASEYLQVKHDDIFMSLFLFEQAITKLGYRIKAGNPSKIGIPVPARGFRDTPSPRHHGGMRQRRYSSGYVGRNAKRRVI